MIDSDYDWAHIPLPGFENLSTPPGLAVGWKNLRDSWLVRPFDDRTPPDTIMAVNFDGRTKTVAMARAELAVAQQSQPFVQPSPAPQQPSTPSQPSEPPAPLGVQEPPLATPSNSEEAVSCQGPGVTGAGQCPFPASHVYFDGSGDRFDVCGECYYGLTVD